MKILASEKLSSHKYKTPEGYLICTDSILARTGKQDYIRKELFGDNCENPEDVIWVDRRPDEVFSKETLSSFENKPITVDHPNEDVNSSNYKELAVGYVRDVKRDKLDDGTEVIKGNLVITDEKTIEEILNGEHTDLSCGYECDILDEDNPQQRRIRGNHVALCEEGRAGVARIVDSKLNDANMKDWTQNEVKRFKIEKRGRGYGVYYKGQLVSKYNDYDKEEAEYELDRLKKYYYVDSKTRDVDSKIRDEDRQLEVYKLCKANNWYTLGDTEDYEYMLNNADIWPVEKIAMNIANHSKQGFNEILTKLKIKLKDSNIRDTWSGTRNGIIYSYENGFYYITHRNGKVERLPSDTFSNIKELYKYVDKINDSVDDMAQKVIKSIKAKDMAYFEISEDYWDEVTNNGDDDSWITQEYNVDIKRAWRRVKVSSAGSRRNLERLYKDYHLRDYGVRIIDRKVKDSSVLKLKIEELTNYIKKIDDDTDGKDERYYIEDKIMDIKQQLIEEFDNISNSKHEKADKISMQASIRQMSSYFGNLINTLQSKSKFVTDTTLSQFLLQQAKRLNAWKQTEFKVDDSIMNNSKKVEKVAKIVSILSKIK